MNLQLLTFLETKQGQTRRAYKADYNDFFGGDPSEEEMVTFLSLPQKRLEQRLHDYERLLWARRLSEATITRRLAALRSFLVFAAKKRWTTYQAPAISRSRKAKSPSTSGEDGSSNDGEDYLQKVEALCSSPGNASLQALRSTAMLRVMSSCALNRSQVCALNLSDWNSSKGLLQVAPEAGEQQVGKGLHLFPIVHIPLERTANDAIKHYAEQAGHGDPPTAPLFGSLSRRRSVSGERLTVDGIYYLTRTYGQECGWECVSPRLLRQVAIQAAWIKANSDLIQVQALLPHLSLDTLLTHRPSGQEELLG